MLLKTAYSLSDFLNQNSSRFLATVLEFGDKGWVIVGEQMPGGTRHLYSETIADPAEYLRRARAGIVAVDPEYHNLIADWLSLQGAETGAAAGAEGPFPKTL